MPGKYFLDTNILVYYRDSSEAQKQRILDLLRNEYDLETLRAEELTLDAFLKLVY